MAYQELPRVTGPQSRPAVRSVVFAVAAVALTAGLAGCGDPDGGGGGGGYVAQQAPQQGTGGTR